MPFRRVWKTLWKLWKLCARWTCQKLYDILWRISRKFRPAKIAEKIIRRPAQRRAADCVF